MISGAPFQTNTERCYAPLRATPIEAWWEILIASLLFTMVFLSGLSSAEQPTHNPKEQAERDRVDSLILAGIQQRKSGEYQKSIQTLDDALRLSRDSNYLKGENSGLGFLSLVYCVLKDYKKVLQLRLASLKLVREHPEIFRVSPFDEEPLSLGGVSAAYVWLKDFPSAIRYANESVSVATRRRDNRGDGLGRQLQRLGILLYLTGRYDEAEHNLRLAIDEFEWQVQPLGHLLPPHLPSTGQYDAELTASRWLQRALVAQHRTNEALVIAEGGRSRALAALAASHLQQRQSSTIPPPLSVEQIKQIVKSHQATIVEYSVVYKYDPDLLVEFSNFEDIRAAAILMWVIKPDGSIAFGQSDLPEEKESLTEMVSQARSSLGAYGRGRSQEAAAVLTDDDSALRKERLQLLYRVLIEPIQDRLPKAADAPIIFIPQDRLFFVPFSALQDESGKYLIETHTLFEAISIQMLGVSAQQQQRSAARPGTGVLVVGNPTMPKLQSEEGGLPMQLPSLPGAEKEARAIATLFATEPLIGSAASKENVLARMPSARILHFATHGLLDTSNGGYLSSLALAPSADDSGFLTIREFSGLTLNAEMAVLSACDTAEGKLSGDGVQGFSHAFSVTGVPSIVVSLWAIQDEPTAELMTEFYEGLQHKLNKAESLRHAMLLTMKRHPNPGSWAAFELIGEAEASTALQTAHGNSPESKLGDKEKTVGLALPGNIRDYSEEPDANFSDQVSLHFDTSMSIIDLVKFYRDIYLHEGLGEDKLLTQIEPNYFTLVFLGQWKDRTLVIQGTSDPAKREERTVSMRFEPIR
jgi:CHAT domain-containing protein